MFDRATLQKELGLCSVKLGEIRSVMKAMPVTGDLSLKPALQAKVAELGTLVGLVTGEKPEEPKVEEETDGEG